MKKRGVSPLIATVLLIAFTVALGAVVMNWGRTYVEDTAASVKEGADKERICSQDVRISLEEFSSIKQICYGGASANGYLFMRLYNNGNKDIMSLSVVIYGAGNTQTNNSVNGTAFNVSKPMKLNLTYDYDAFGSVKKVKIIPEVKLSGVLKSCGGNSLDIDSAELMNCTNM